MAALQSGTGKLQPNRPRPSGRTRTAVLVVHGMGSQRALETVRGVIDAVWLQDPANQASPRPKPAQGAANGPHKVWTHPEYSGVDMDLSVMTTSGLSVHTPAGKITRSVDFHELYWAHLMSETRAVAVLLWLFELVRKGPLLKPGMKSLWWGASIFLCMLLASLVLLAMHAILQFLGSPPLLGHDGLLFGAVNASGLITMANHGYHDPQTMVLAPFFVLFMVATYITLAALWKRAPRIGLPALVLTFASFWIYFRTGNTYVGQATVIFLPIVASLFVARVAMGWWGALVMAITYLSAGMFFVVYLHSRYMINWDSCLFYLPAWLSPNRCVPRFTGMAPFEDVWREGWIFWSLNERFSAMIAVSMISIYLAAYALFLQPYLGDAARYFRNSPGNVAVRREIRKQAVDTLDALHLSERYDRVVVVAHSLGTVVAYDMLRSYFSRIRSGLPDPATLGPELQRVDAMIIDDKVPGQREALRRDARAIVRNIAAAAPSPAGDPSAKWLVTDFVTLGSPLTHAHYLMCNGESYPELTADFDRRVREREYPTCPPLRDADLNPDDGLLLFTNPNTKRQQFHHGGLFALTRWTNLYFPLHQLFWGDAIGGPLAPFFQSHVRDVEVTTHHPPRDKFFTHTAYWSLKWPNGRGAPHIKALQEAINLEDV